MLPQRILRAARAFGHFQARVVLSVVYVLLMWPVGLFVRRGDPLRLREGLPGWIPRPVAEPTLERFSHPF